MGIITRYTHHTLSSAREKYQISISMYTIYIYIYVCVYIYVYEIILQCIYIYIYIYIYYLRVNKRTNELQYTMCCKYEFQDAIL